jgi:cyclopropane fatty-acyl-phospholipid synthase-like methyltransferase
MGKELLSKETLETKQPTLQKNDDLQFEDFEAREPFDYIISIGVFTQLQRDHVRECFENLDRVLAPSGEFYVNFNTGPGAEERQLSLKSYSFSEETLRQLALEYGLHIERVPEGPHCLSNQPSHRLYRLTWSET